MALTVASIQPSRGRTGGQYAVKLSGLDFRLPTASAVAGPTPVPPPSVRVRFGSVPATRVDVLSSSTVLALVPPLAPGVHVVTVENLSNAGAVLESAVVPGGFTARLPDLVETANTSTVVAVVRKLIQDFKRQVLAEDVVVTTSADYPENALDGKNIRKLAKLPVIVLSGPRFRTNRQYASNVARYVVDQGDPMVSRELRPPATRDLEFQLTVAACGHVTELIALMHEVEAYFERTPYLEVGGVKYEMQRGFADDFASDAVGNDDGVYQSSAGFVVRGVDIDDVANETRWLAEIVDDVEVSIVQFVAE